MPTDPNQPPKPGSNPNDPNQHPPIPCAEAPLPDNLADAQALIVELRKNGLEQLQVIDDKERLIQEMFIKLADLKKLYEPEN